MSVTVDYTGWACQDCLIMIANGEAPCDLTESELAGYLADVERLTAGYHLVAGLPSDEHTCEPAARAAGCGCETIGFSWHPCEVCGGNLGGDRFAVSFLTAG